LIWCVRAAIGRTSASPVASLPLGRFRHTDLMPVSRRLSLRGMLLGLACFTLWLNANPYIGIDHDARLYALMAFRWVNPEAYLRDPWFAYGSQDAYSIFSPLLAQVFLLFGVAKGALLATLTQGVLFALSALVLARSGLGRAGYGLAAMVMVSFPLLYSPSDMLYVTEGFVTARGFAVPLSLMGLAFSVRRRYLPALSFHVLAFSLHPIMALAPAAVSFLLGLDGAWRRRLALAGVVGYVSLLYAGTRGWVPVIDGVWRFFVEPAPLIFVGNWVAGDAGRLACQVAFLVLAGRLGTCRLRPLYQMTALVAVLGVAFSLLAGAVPVVLAMQAQFWRGLWLLQLIVLLAGTDLFLRHLLRCHARFRRLAALLAMSLSLAFLLAPWLALLLMLLMVLTKPAGSRAVLVRMELHLRTHPAAYIVALAGVGVLLLPFWAMEVASRTKTIVTVGLVNEFIVGFWRNAGLGVVALIWWRLRRRRGQVAFSLLLVAALPFAALNWDMRSAGQKAAEAHYDPAGQHSPFAGWIHPGSTVYWHESPEKVWLQLTTAGYASTTHVTGMVFSRTRTELLHERLGRVALATRRDAARYLDKDWRDVMAGLPGQMQHMSLVRYNVLESYEVAGRLSRNGIRLLCGDPELDFVVDQLRLEGNYAAVADQAQAGSKEPYYLYRCADLRR